MRVVVVATLALLVMAALSGCVGSETEETPSTEPADSEPMESAGQLPATADEMPEPVVVDTPFTAEGATPARMGVCGFPEPAPRCIAHPLGGGGTYSIEIPHTGNVTAIDFTLTFQSSIPGLKIFYMVHRVDETNERMLGGGELTSGSGAKHEGLDINATAKILFYAWPVGQQTPAAYVWVDPVSVPYKLEGTLTEALSETT